MEKPKYRIPTDGEVITFRKFFTEACAFVSGANEPTSRLPFTTLTSLVMDASIIRII